MTQATASAPATTAPKAGKDPSPLPAKAPPPAAPFKAPVVKSAQDGDALTAIETQWLNHLSIRCQSNTMPSDQKDPVKLHAEMMAQQAVLQFLDQLRLFRNPQPMAQGMTPGGK